MIDHGAAEFPYEQLAAILRSRIASGEYAAGRKIPPLLELQEEFGLSSMTVRRAVRLLAAEGLLVLVPGRGTFVRRNPELQAPRHEAAHRTQDASGCILTRPERTRAVPLASPPMEAEDDEPAGRIPLRRGEWRYRQVADDLERRIRSGEFGYDSALPRRGDLAAEYAVGVMTVRHALRVLAERGLVRPMPSVGTVVIWQGTERAHDNPNETD